VTILFLVRDLGLPAWAVGLLLAVSAVGAMLASALTPWLARRIGSARLVWVSLAVTGPLTLLVALGFPGWGLVFVVTGMFAGELGQIVYAITNVSLRQRICPDRILARVNATMRVAIMGLFPLGALVGGVLGELIGVRATIVVAGVVVLAAPIVLVAALRRHRDVEDFAPDSVHE
jgi:predicted MFS family arabinose efflux permease